MKQAKITPHVYKDPNIPFNVGQIDAIKSQCLCAVISPGSLFRFFEDPEVIKLFKLMRTMAQLVLPTRKSIDGKLLNDASGKIKGELDKLL